MDEREKKENKWMSKNKGDIRKKKETKTPVNKNQVSKKKEQGEKEKHSKKKLGQC